MRARDALDTAIHFNPLHATSRLIDCVRPPPFILGVIFLINKQTRPPDMAAGGLVGPSASALLASLLLSAPLLSAAALYGAAAPCRRAAMAMGGSAHGTARVPPPVACGGDGWFFTSVRSDDDSELGPTLPGLLSPLAPLLWVGERREIRLREPREYSLLSSLATNATFVHLATRASVVGVNATVARVVSLSLSRAIIVGLGRRTVRAKAAERPHLLVRGRVLLDRDQDLEELRRASARFTESWLAALELTKRRRERQLAAKLRVLGSAASAVLLSMPESDQLELGGRAGSRDGTPPQGASRPLGSLDEALEVRVGMAQRLELRLVGWWLELRLVG